MTKIHHLNCGTLNPLFPRGVQSVLYCLLVETNDGLLLVDTGFGVRDYQQPTRFIRMFTASLGMPRAVEETALHQIERRGYSREDVRHIVLTHMHCDHAGGLPDFPDARVHIYAQEYDAIQSPRGFKERFYTPVHWAHGPDWVIYSDENSEDWFGLPSIVVLPGLSPEVRLVPLTGHTRGHCGVAVKTENGWLMHCGDATYPFYHREQPPPPFKPLPRYVTDPPRWLESSLIGDNTPRLRDLLENHGDQIQLVCSNDSISYALHCEDE